MAPGENEFDTPVLGDLSSLKRFVTSQGINMEGRVGSYMVLKFGIS